MEDHLRAALNFLQPDETAAQFLARSFVEQIHTGLPIIDLRAPLRATHVVEISGLASTGKTEILYSIAATCILPAFKNGIAYGGHGSNVLYLDLDCKFDIVRIAEILQSRVMAAHSLAGLSRPSIDLITEIVTDSVGRLFLISCPSSFHLLAALKIIKPEATRLSQTGGGLAAVLVDNVTAHYYIDRAIKGGTPSSMTTVVGAAAVAGGAQENFSLGVSLTLGKVHSAMVVGLKNLQHALRVPIITTKHVFSAAPQGGGSGSAWVYRDVMLKPWQEFVTHRLVLKKVGMVGSGGGGGSGVGGFQGHVAKWIKPEVPVDDRFRVDTAGVVVIAASSSSSNDATRNLKKTDWKDYILQRLDDQDYTTSAPLIGVLSQPHYHKHHQDSQTISGPLVSWVESAGGRVVPISYNAPWEQIEKIFKSINGLVLPGGSGELWYGHPFFDTAARLLQLAKKSNDNGNVFPVFGICLGFETLHIILANRTREDLLVASTGQESVANTLELTEEADSSLFFTRWSEAVMDQVAESRLQPTFNAHEWAVPLEAYDNNKALRNELTILSTSKDTAGELYVSTVEGRNYPFFATQWHPEKPPYEFSDKTIPHTRTAIDAASLTASLLVDVARLNSNSVDYSTQVKLVIDNYDRHFVAAEGVLDEDDPLPDTLWFIPQPQHARTDPEDYPPEFSSSEDDDVVVNEVAEELLKKVEAEVESLISNSEAILGFDFVADMVAPRVVDDVVVGFKGEHDVRLDSSIDDLQEE